jgi:hypothetical protein
VPQLKINRRRHALLARLEEVSIIILYCGGGSVRGRAGVGAAGFVGGDNQLTPSTTFIWLCFHPSETPSCLPTTAHLLHKYTLGAFESAGRRRFLSTRTNAFTSIIKRFSGPIW